MKLNTTENVHGILQGSYNLTEHATGHCRAALHNGTLYCVYLGEGGEIMYMMKSPTEQWGSPITLRPVSARDSYMAILPEELPPAEEYVIVSDNTPSLVSFKDQLWLIYTDENKNTVFYSWNASKATFLHVQQLKLEVQQAATFAELDNKLYMIYKLEGSPNIYCNSTTDMLNWDRRFLVMKDSLNTALSNLSPVAITYQGLIHLFYKDINGGFFLLKSDGKHWTSAISLISADYLHSPGIAVHNGLLKLIFCNLSNNTDSTLHQYTYDGNSLSPMVASRMLSATHSPALSTQDGKLIAMYMENADTH